MDRTAIEAVMEQTDLLALVEQAGGQMKKNGDGWRGTCPLHKGDNPTSFSIFKGTDGLDRWQCFADCNTGGDSIEFIRQWRGLDFKNAIEYLGGSGYQVDPQELARLASERAEGAAKRLEQEIEQAQKILADLQQAEKHLQYHDHAPAWTKEAWTKRGLDESWQGFYYLGGCADFLINDGYHTPTLTIPIFDEKRDVLNIRHRLLKPQTPHDKYRPERPGLRSVPFLALPELGYDAELTVVVEGEIKAAVTYSRIGGIDWQIIGVPGQGMLKHMAEKLAGKNVVGCPDPGAEKAMYDFLQLVGGRYFELPDKIDDWILEVNADKDDIYSLVRQARRV